MERHYKQEFLGSLIVVIVFLISGAISASEQPPAGVKVIEAPDLKVGDTWTYIYKEGSVLKTAGEVETSKRVYIVESITDKEIIVAVSRGEGEAWWKETYDRQWNTISHPDRGDHQFREFSPSSMSFVFPLWEGKKWKAKYKVKTAIWEGDYESKGMVVGWEKVTVPAGTFEALKIVNKITWSRRRTDTHRDFEGEGEAIFWYAPEVKRFVKSTWEFLEARAGLDVVRRTQLS